MALFVLVAGVAALGAAALAAASAAGPVSRRRVEAFASRHRLSITPDNGAVVIRYLAVTRQWRAAGLAGGLVVSVAAGLPDSAIRINGLALFGGWFVGALVAEARLAGPPAGLRRAASLVPRRAGDYLPPALWHLIPAVTAAAAAVPLLLAVRHGWPVAAPAVAWSVGIATVGIVVRVIQSQVLRRSQPATAPDVVAADDAVRSRSLHVLTGAGVTLLVYGALLAAGAVPAGAGAAGDESLAAVHLVGALFAPLVGWMLAHRPWTVSRPPLALQGPA